VSARSQAYSRSAGKLSHCSLEIRYGFFNRLGQFRW
jgi:hypothetical protein